MRIFFYSVQSEWMKKRRSAAAWLTICGGFLIPIILLVARIDDYDLLVASNAEQHCWEILYNKAWQFMGLFLLPMGVILTASLVTQLEYRNNTWKQLHTTPQSLSVIFFAKLLVILLMMLHFFILFNAGIYLAGIIPSFFFSKIPFPIESFPIGGVLRSNSRFYIACLPIIGLQYLISLQYKNFLIPIGVGLALYVSSMIALSWKYAYLLPFAYCALNFDRFKKAGALNIPIHVWELSYFTLFLIISYILYISKREKG